MSGAPITSLPVTLQKLWDQANFHPNEAQREAILHVNGPLYLTAGPGSGKTRVLLWRTLNLIVFHDVAPEQIFLSTFTEKAALQLKEGLQSLLGMVTNHTGQPYDLAQMYIGTVHSLCQRMLSDRRRFSRDRHRNHPPSLLDEIGQYFHLAKSRSWANLLDKAELGETGNEIINAIFGGASQSKHVAVTNCISFFNRLSEECIDPQKALSQLQNGEIQRYFASQSLIPEQIEVLLKLYSAYKESLIGENNNRFTDFSLLQQEAYNTLFAFDGSDKAFQYVIVDEYQDTNTIQEKIFFKLAQGSKNLCVVGDDDQALYRFRGATVENFVEFPSRCQALLGVQPRRIPLSINYRSCKRIVDFYTSFIGQADWTKANGESGFYRVVDKDIRAKQQENQPAVVASTPDQPEAVCQQIATLVRRLIDEGKVENPNQVAFLFPSLKYRGEMVQAVSRMKDALEAVGLRVYAPRAGRFLEVNESYDIFGLFLQIFGRPRDIGARGHDYDEFQQWLLQVEATGASLRQEDPMLDRFIRDRRDELIRTAQDYTALLQTVQRNRWNASGPYDAATMKRPLYNTPGLSEEGKRLLASAYLDRVAKDRAQKGQPLSINYILKRVTSIDWNVLDLFYRFCGFEHFKQMFDQAEREGDEGPVVNLGLITQYLGRFMEEYVPIITADLLVENLFQAIFFYSYLFALYRLGETEVEDAEDPFPKGRIPFLTIHQAKGLEFPVVVLGNPRKDNKGPQKVEILARPFLERSQGEPLERMAEFDMMRMFYVALSRAKNLLVIAHYQGRGQRINEPFRVLLNNGVPRIPQLDLSMIPTATLKEETLPKSYSFTSDFLSYKKCPREYMIFRKYGFTPSRSQTMFFGNLVHQTLEDLHHELIRRRQEK
jgi:DNA helicase-2/ATP-dependent DNA helicase PcrA